MLELKTRHSPNSKDSEMMVLGCMINSINSFNIGSDSLDDSDFYYIEHKTIFKTLKSAYLNDSPVDVHLICEELNRQGNLKSVGGVDYILTISQFSGTSAHIEAYIKIIKDKCTLRRMIQASQLIEKSALEEPEKVEDILDEAQSLLFKISQSSGSDKSVTIKEIVTGQKNESKKSFMQEIKEKVEDFKENGDKKGGVTGISSGLIDLDKMINGLNNSNLMILAARPAMGKTALAVNIAEHVCFKLNMPVGIFSLEMGDEQLVHRIICSQAEVESEKIKTGNLSGIDIQKIHDTVDRIEKSVMVVDDQEGMKITDLRSRARRMKEVYGIKFLVIDYLQLISGSGSLRGTENRQNEISEISRMLKNLAKELNIPVLCLSQLSRKVEERSGHRPMMSDLRESGSIEQDADIVMFLLRREYYDAMDKPGTAELIIAKNRHGGVGSVNLMFRKDITQFQNYTPIEAPENLINKYEGQFS